MPASATSLIATLRGNAPLRLDLGMRDDEWRYLGWLSPERSVPREVIDAVTSLAPHLVAHGRPGRSAKWGAYLDIEIPASGPWRMSLTDLSEGQDFPDDPDDYVEEDCGSWILEPELIGDIMVETPEDQASLGL